LRHFI